MNTTKFFETEDSTIEQADDEKVRIPTPRERRRIQKVRDLERKLERERKERERSTEE